MHLAGRLNNILSRSKRMSDEKGALKMKRILIFCFILLLTASFSFAAGEEVITLRIGTSRIAGSFQLWGITWSKLITDKIKGIRAGIEATGGPAANIMLIEKKINELGIANNVATQEAWRGIGWAKGIKYQRQRAVFAMYPSYLQLITLKKSGIRKVADFTGKNVDVGPPGTSPDLSLKAMIEALGINPTIRRNDAKVALEALKNGNIDVYARTTGLPNASIMDVASGHDIYIVGFKPEELNKILSKYPYFATGTIPAKVYKGQGYAVKTISFWNMSLVDKELPEDVVYKITKVAFENRETFIKAHPDGKYLVPENVKYCNIPLHPGAIKYYNEIGQKIPDELILK